MSGNTGSAFPFAPRCRHNRANAVSALRRGGRLMDTLEARRDPGCDIGLEQSYIERARELQPMLRAAGDEIERNHEVTPEVVAAMKDRGIFRMLLPRSLGGAALDPLTYTEGLYTLAQADGSTAWC